VTIWYGLGTVAVTNGETTVTGTLTAWLAMAKPGDEIYFDADDRGYEVTAVNENTELEIDPPYAGSTGSGKAYRLKPIGPGWNSVTELSTSVAELLTLIGNQVTNGVGVPSDETGNDGDTYIRTDVPSIYAKESGAWVLKATITGAAGAAGPSYQATSTTSLLIEAASKTFTLAETSRGYTVGQRLRATDTANSANYMEGLVTAYSGTTLILNASRVGGSGTIASWAINITGDVGPANSLAVGSVTTGAAGSSAAVEITGSPPSQTVNFTIPRGNTGIQGDPGAQGDAGTAATIEVGTVTTLNPGDPATVENSGTTSEAVFDFGIPPGDTGAGYGGTSTTSLLIEAAEKTFTTQAGLAYAAGSRVRAASAADPDDWMEGPCTSYTSTTLVIDVDLVGPLASGTHADWTFSITGERGVTGPGSLDSVNGDFGPNVILNGSDVEANVVPVNYAAAGASIADHLAGVDEALGNVASGGAPHVEVASASTVDLGATSDLYWVITGTTTINSYGTVPNIWRIVRFTDVLTQTYHATTLVLPGAANITTAAGDIAVLLSDDDGNWRCWSYQRANGRSVNLGTAALAILLDEDDMASDSATGVPSQQSVKAYVDEKVSVTDYFLTDGTYTRELSPRLELSADFYLVGGGPGGGGAQGTTSQASVGCCGGCPGQNFKHYDWVKVAIEGLTNANPCVINSTAHPWFDDDVVYYEGVTGTTGMNGNTFTVTYIDADHYSINFNSTSAGAWLGGGTADFRSCPVVIGEGGPGGAAGFNAGTIGGNSSFRGMAANSGGQGNSQATDVTFGAPTGGTGGAATGGDINITGEQAARAYRMSGSQVICVAPAPSPLFGTGGAHVNNVAGSPGVGYGAPGGGASTIGATSRAGGDGSDGVMMARRNF
jgi:hypothetical protein